MTLAAQIRSVLFLKFFNFFEFLRLKNLFNTFTLLNLAEYLATFADGSKPI